MSSDFSTLNDDCKLIPLLSPFLSAAHPPNLKHTVGQARLQLGSVQKQ